MLSKHLYRLYKVCYGGGQGWEYLIYNNYYITNNVSLHELIKTNVGAQFNPVAAVVEISTSRYIASLSMNKMVLRLVRIPYGSVTRVIWARWTRIRAQNWAETTIFIHCRQPKLALVQNA